MDIIQRKSLISAKRRDIDLWHPACKRRSFSLLQTSSDPIPEGYSSYFVLLAEAATQHWP
jgi:hypothetical protein